MSLVVLILLVSSIAIGFVIGRMSSDDRPDAEVRRRKAGGKPGARPGARQIRRRP